MRIRHLAFSALIWCKSSGSSSEDTDDSEFMEIRHFSGPSHSTKSLISEAGNSDSSDSSLSKSQITEDDEPVRSLPRDNEDDIDSPESKVPLQQETVKHITHSENESAMGNAIRDSTETQNSVVSVHQPGVGLSGMDHALNTGNVEDSINESVLKPGTNVNEGVEPTIFTNVGDTESSAVERSGAEEHRAREYTNAHFDAVSSTVNELSELLSQLYGTAVTDFAKDAKSYDKEILEIDCNDRTADHDAKLNIVTTLCPFLRDEDGPCGVVRHSSYTVVDSVKLCSEECVQNIDAIMTALPRRKYLARKANRKHEASIFRAIVNTILLQYASECRVGTWFMPN